jgi:carbamoyltransferase
LYILGLNLSHDRSACLVRDGKIVTAIAEERLDGHKGSTLYAGVRKRNESNRMPPFRAIRYCLDAAGIGMDDLDLIVMDHAVEPVNIDSLASLLPIRDRSKVRSIPHPSHHTAHAYSAYFCSPFEESAVLVADTYGSQTPIGTEAESGFHAKGNVVSPVLKNYQNVWSEKAPDQRAYYSLTYIYNFISLALGFSSQASRKRVTGISVSDAGKTMGLAPFGMPRPEWPRIVDIRGDRLETERFTQWALELKIGEVHDGVLMPVRKPERQKLTQFHKDLAYAAQAEIEEGLIFLANRLHEITGSRNLCIAGGAGLNSVANKKILDNTPFENIFIQPASTDDGNAIGCALYGWHELAKGTARHPMRNAYLGTSYSGEKVQAALGAHGIVRNELAESALIEQVASALADGRIVGWFQGGSEIGPRALGHRSILGDPRRASMKDLINRKVKHRESFRPYAPSVMEEFASDYFDLDCPSPYMLLVAKVKPGKAEEIPAAIHVDDTARVQTVNEADNGIWYRLLSEFHRLTGVPVLLNTSFNTRGMPIVEDPGDAIELFLNSEMDVLVLDHCICTKTEKDVLAAQASFYGGIKQLAKALKTLKRATANFPEDGLLHALHAKYLHAGQRYLGAVESAGKALALGVVATGDVNLHGVLGHSFENLGRFSEAIPELEKAARLEPDEENIDIALVRCYRETDQTALMNNAIFEGFKKRRQKLSGL